MGKVWFGVALSWAVALAATAGATGASKPAGYLADKSIEMDLNYRVPKVPDNRSEVGRMDLAMVVMAQTNDPARYQEAYEDAVAYGFVPLMGRFKAAAGTDISPETRPILAHILSRIIADSMAYAGFAKAAGNRPRPYIEDPRIVPCETDFLRHSDQQSYPSGHATNGYAAALIMADIMPERAQPLLERGIRFGMSRVICGVHHPIDVEQGRLLAIAIFAAARQQPEYAADLACAKEEDRHSLYIDFTLTEPCKMLNMRYRSDSKAG